jgi:CRISPR type I-E-associated protein CasB/Cse2
MRSKDVRERADQLVTRLEKWHERQDRGVLARLRRGLSRTTQQEAWTVLGPWFGPTAVDCPVYQTVAGCFALHPVIWTPLDDAREEAKRNFGWTFREARLAEPEGNKKMRDEKEPHTRFRRLLACSDTNEISEHIRHSVRLVKSKEKDVNYRKLFEDLWWWNDWTKIAWAKAYWSVPADVAEFTLAGVGTPVAEEPAPMPE